MAPVPALVAAAAIARLDGALLTVLAARLRGFAQLLRDASRSVVRIPAEWTGAGRRAFEQRAAAVRARLQAFATTVETLALLASALAAQWQTVQGESAAASRVLGVDDGSRGAVDAQLRLAVEAFDEADRRVAAGVRESVLGGPLARPGSRLLPLAGERAAQLAAESTRAGPIPAQPAAVSVWWGGLPAASRDRLSGWSWIVGGLDGAPPRLRDALNRQRLAAALAGPQPPLRRLSSTLRALLAALARPGSELLSLDLAGDGTAVVATGDIEAAADVAVLVPGMATELDDVPRLVGQTRALAAAAGGATVAVAWLGYDAPSVLQVISDARARQGAPLLRRFAAGLRATAGRRQHLTVIGHSYGTLVAGLAARRSLPVDELVLLASPGVEAGSASALRVPKGHVWAARAASDPIRLVFWPAGLARRLGLPVPDPYGPDPAGAGFGARTFSVRGAQGHSSYLQPGSVSLRNLGRIVTGRSPDVG